MQYSPALILAVAALGVTASPAINLRQADGGDPSLECLPGIPATNVSLSTTGLAFSITLCCPGIVSNGGGDDDSVCLIGGDCGVVADDKGALSTTGSCVATVPIAATDYAAQISSAYDAAGKPSVHNSALVTGEVTGTDNSATPLTATGVPAVTTSAGGSASGSAAATPAVTSMGNATAPSATASSGAPTSTTASGDALALRAPTTQGSVAALFMLVLGAAFV